MENEVIAYFFHISVDIYMHNKSDNDDTKNTMKIVSATICVIGKDVSKKSSRWRRFNSVWITQMRFYTWIQVAQKSA